MSPRCGKRSDGRPGRKTDAQCQFCSLSDALKDHLPWRSMMTAALKDAIAVPLGQAGTDVDAVFPRGSSRRHGSPSGIGSASTRLGGVRPAHIHRLRQHDALGSARGSGENQGFGTRRVRARLAASTRMCSDASWNGRLIGSLVQRRQDQVMMPEAAQLFHGFEELAKVHGLLDKVLDLVQFRASLKPFLVGGGQNHDGNLARSSSPRNFRQQLEAALLGQQQIQQDQIGAQRAGEFAGVQEESRASSPSRNSVRR